MTRQVGVCVVCHPFPPEYTGAGRVALALSSGLQARGYRVFVLTRSLDSITTEEDVEGIKVIRVNARVCWPRVPLEYALRIARVLFQRRNEFEVMLIFGRSCLPFWTIMVSRFLGKRVVYRMTLLSSDDPAAIKGRGWLAWLRFRLLSQAAAFVATSTPLVESYRRCQLPESKLHLIPNGVDTERFVGPLPLTEKKALRRDLRIAPDAQVLAFVGMLYRRKGIDILLQTFQKLLTEREDLVLLLVGPEAPSPGHPTFLEGLAESNHTHTLDGRVIHTGQQEAIERYLRAADVFVFPSRREGFPSAVIEAMSCGLPVVISQMDGIAQDIITPGLDGYIVNELTPIAFSKAITPLLDEPTLRTRIGQNARQTVCQRFSIERMVSRYAALIESLVGHPVDGGRM